MLIAGVDEVGKGALAGPIAVGICVVDTNTETLKPAGLNDSKKVSAPRRVRMAPKIMAWCEDWSLGMATAAEIDDHGIMGAQVVAANRALAGLSEKLELDMIDQWIVDGDWNFMGDLPNLRCIPKADGKFPAVSAASILAKVGRDGLMEKHAVEYPDYGFERHSGYGTKAHMAAIREHGPCVEHRVTWAPFREMATLF